MDLQGHRNLDTQFAQGERDACAWCSPVSIAKLHTQFKTQNLENQQIVRSRLRQNNKELLTRKKDVHY